ncbi:MAG TPA: hypothetical protein VEJ87_13555 [Acidimicrobiales bacterium]|nr:hypothetical protein [Acidimicrobiales bacterium]
MVEAAAFGAVVEVVEVVVVTAGCVEPCVDGGESAPLAATATNVVAVAAATRVMHPEKYLSARRILGCGATPVLMGVAGQDLSSTELATGHHQSRQGEPTQ